MNGLKKKSKGKWKIISKQMKMKIQHIKICGMQQKQFWGTFITINAYIKKSEKPQINNLTLHLKELEKGEQVKPKVSRRKEIIKIRTEINEIVKVTEENIGDLF